MALVMIPVTTSSAYAANTWDVFVSPYDGVDKTELFRPLELPINSGDKIIFRNQDSTNHQIVSGVPQHPDFAGEFFSTNILSPGSASSIILDFQGYAAYYYYCEIHPWYVGKIFFEDNPNMYDSTLDLSYQTLDNDNITVKGLVDSDFGTTIYEIMVFDSINNLVFQTLDTFKKDSTFEQQIDTSSSVWHPDEQYTLKLVYGVPSESRTLQLEIPTKNTNDKLKTNALDVCLQSQFDSELIFENISIPKWYGESLCWFTEGYLTEKEISDSLEFFQKTL